MKYIVYQTTNKENGKLYIGVHKTENPDIFDGYIGNGVYVGYSLENPKTAYQHALKKYGYKNFIRTTLFTYDNLEDALNKEASLVTAEFVKNDNNYNTAIGGGCIIIYKTVYLFNNRKELIKTWEGNYSIAEFYGISRNQIQYAIHNNKILLDSYFSYDKIPEFDSYTKYKNNTLYLFDFYGNLVNTFRSVREASELLNLSFKSLETAVTEKKKYKNFFWTHYPETIFNIIKITKLYNTENKPVILYDINKKVLKEYLSIKIAASELGYNYGTIKSAINNKSLVDNKYYFSYTSIVTKSLKVGQYENGSLIKIWDTVAQCAKIHPKCREVLKGQRRLTHGYTFKYIE